MDWWLRWLHDLARVASGAAARHFSRAEGQLEALAGRASLRAWLALERRARARAEWVRHPLNLRLFLEDVLSDYVDTVGG